MTRRSIIATAAGLAAAASWSKFSAAQSDELTLPDAATSLNTFPPTAAPPLVFYNAQGKRLTLAAYAGHVLIVNLWATWCGPCTAELPTFAALAPQLKPSGILILPISIDQAGASTVRPFYTAQNIHTLPILLDPNGNDMDILNTNGVPTTIIVTPTGKMIARLDGAANWNTPATLAYLRTLATPHPTDDGFTPAAWEAS